MPSATFTHVATTPRTAEEVWNRLQNADTWANIGPVGKVWDPVHEGESLVSYRWDTKVGPTRYEGTAVVSEAVPAARMKLDLDAREVRGSLTTDLAAGAEGTSISVTLVVESRGMLSTMFFPVISEAVGSGLPTQVEEFARSFSD